MMAVEDDSFCLTHEKNRVALYCKTCEVLICTRCVSHGSQSSARHRDHVYLDLNEAFDMLQVCFFSFCRHKNSNKSITDIKVKKANYIFIKLS